MQQLFLDTLRYTLLGQSAPEPPELTEDAACALLKLADLHKITPLFFQGVYHWSAIRGCPLFPQVRQLVRRQVLRQAQRTQEFLRLARLAQQQSLRLLVVKGIVCRSLYPQPDHRPSADEDLLIHPADFHRCHDLFSDFGLLAQGSAEPKPEDHETPYRKQETGLYIELHRSLFPPDSESYGAFNRFFEGAMERAIPLTVDGAQLWTLDDTDHLLYLILHAFKHFLHSGFGIRQLCDIILFSNAYGSRVQWDRIVESCRAVRAEQFAAALFRIGEKHLVFQPEQACFPQCWQSLAVDEGPMLADLMSAGLYGDASMSRKHSSAITLDAFSAQDRGGRSSALLVSLFPPADRLRNRYPYLEKYPWLLPVAWSSRILRYRSRTPADPLRIGKERVALLKFYGIIS